MEECFKCHVPETKALLFDAILSEGIVKICNKCSAKEDIPIIKEASSPGIEKQQTVRERLSKISGVDIDKKTSFKLKEKNELKELVDKNYNFKENLELKKELIHNFHWIVMRARRMKHLTQEQFAREIHEPEIVIKQIEKGFAPEKVETIRKLEKYLGIRIREHTEHENLQEELKILETNKTILPLKSFDAKNFDDLTISDLYEMKKKKEMKVLGDDTKTNED